MVDQESGTYRPRRAFIEPDVEPAPPLRPAQPGRNGNGRAPVRPEPAAGRPSTGPVHRPVRSRVSEDQPKPLYRDDVRPNGSSRPASRAAAMPADPPTEETLMTPATLAPRRPPPRAEDETTTILPRSRPTKHRTQALDAIDDYNEEERPPLGRHAKLAILIGGIAAVVVIGLLIGYAVRSAAKQPQNQASHAPSTDGSSQGASSAQGQNGGALLSDESMLSPSQAKTLANRTWKIVTTQAAATENGPVAACFGGEPLEGQPTPQQESVRVLKASGSNAPTALHAASAYNSSDEATLAYAIASKTLGGCAVAGYWIESGALVSGIGDQAAGAVIMERTPKNDWRAHSVVLNRSGRVMNVLDTAQPSKAIAMDAVVKALGQLNKVQCASAGGKCTEKLGAKTGPPPLGGDKPGFLAHGDLPPAGPKVYPWIATDVALPAKEFKGTGCESVKWTTEPAKSRSARSYLVQESGKNFFGLDEIQLMTKDADTANKVIGRLKSSISKCRSTQLTARVTNLEKVASVGAKKTKISGWTAVVTQTSTQGRVKYRVGMVSAGSKVVYTFLNPRAEYDFTNHQWETVAVRAGERATQVN
jgi:hypothetical protein